MDTLEQIIDYIKDQKISWQLPYLPSLNILLKNKDKVNSELLDKAYKNLLTLIYQEQISHLSDKTESMFEELLLYNAFVHYVERSLNINKKKEKPTEYHFMLFPGMTEDTGVSEIYYHEEDCKHVFMMKLQESAMSDRRNMFIVLSHELAHYVGSCIRCRSERLDRIYNIYSRLTVLGLKTTLAQMQSIDDIGEIIDFENEAWNQVEHKLSQWIKLYYERGLNQAFIKETSIYEENNDSKPENYNKKNQEHMFYIPPTMKESIRDMLKYKSRTILEPIITQCFKNISYDERELCIQKCTEEILIDIHPENKIFSFSSAFPYIEYLLKESYADLISILELELTPFQYLHCLVSQYSPENPDKYGLKFRARIALIMLVMCDTDNELSTGYMWDDEELTEILDTKSEESRLLEAVYEYIYETMPDSFFEGPVTIKELYQKVYMVLFDKTILKEISEYLLMCKRKFTEDVNSDSLKEARAFFSGKNYKNYLQEYEEGLKEFV